MKTQTETGQTEITYRLVVEFDEAPAQRLCDVAIAMKISPADLVVALTHSYVDDFLRNAARARK
ncbi:MAG: hypothetical protein ACYC0P_03060 [Thiobacillus sp.]